jgi:hypothetical protein
MIRASVSCVVLILVASTVEAAGLSGTYRGGSSCVFAGTAPRGQTAHASTLVVSETGPGAFAADLDGVAYAGRVDETGSGVLKRRGPVDPGYGSGHGSVLDLRVEPGGAALTVWEEIPGVGSCKGTWTRVAE